MLKTLFFIGIGSFCGGILRFLLSRLIQTFVGCSFPLGTLVVNLTGCLLIGIFSGLIERGGLIQSDLRLFLTVGLCGSFTTFSTFLNENFILLRIQHFPSFFLYTFMSLSVGLLLVYWGYQLAK